MMQISGNILRYIIKSTLKKYVLKIRHGLQIHAYTFYLVKNITFHVYYIDDIIIL